MKKVDFRNIVLKDINEKEQAVDFAAELGNQLYMTGRDIEACQLGKKIYFAKEAVELSEKEVQIVTQAVAGWSYVARTAIEEAMKNE